MLIIIIIMKSLTTTQMNIKTNEQLCRNTAVNVINDSPYAVFVLNDFIEACVRGKFGTTLPVT